MRSLVPNVLVLGPITIATTDGASIDVTGNAGRLLVELLAGGSVRSRDRLLHVLWPDEAPKSADAALRVHLSRLRRLLQQAGAGLERRADGYELVRVTTDLDRFDDLLDIARCREASTSGGGGTAALDRAAAAIDEALALWRGEAFTPFTDDPDVTVLVAHAHTRRREAEDLAADLMLERGLHQRSLGLLEAAAAARPFDEQRWARLMLALYRSGRQREALAVFDQARRSLVDELGVEPGPALRRLQLDILDQDPALEWSAPPDLGHPPLRAAVAGHPGLELVGRIDELVGREDVLDQLRAAMPGRADQLAIVLLSGEPGIGKTAIVERFAQEQSAGRIRALIGRCDRHTAVPLQPFLDALDPFVGPAGGRSGIAAAELFSGSTDSTDSTIRRSDQLELQRHRALVLIGDLVAELAADEPLLIGVDDAQWADPMSLALVSHLARAHASAPVLLVLTARRADLTGGALDATMTDLSRQVPVIRIEVPGLPAEAIGELLGPDTPVRSREIIHGASGGNPLYALQLKELIGDDPVDRAELPADLHHLCQARISALSPTGLELVEAAALLGPEVDAGAVAALLGWTRLACSRPLVEVQLAGILKHGDGFDRFRFVHGIMRQVIYESIEVGQRAHLHLAAARLLEQDPDHHLGEVSRHLTEARPLVTDREIAAAAVRAGAAALLIGDHGTAARHYRIVIELTSPAPEQRVTARFGLGLGLAGGGDEADSDASFAAGLAEARTLGRWDLFADIVIARMKFGPAPTIPDALREIGEIDEALVHLPSSESERRGYLLCWKADLLVNISADASRDTLAEATALGDHTGGSDLVAMIEIVRLREEESACTDPVACGRSADALVARAAATSDHRLACRAGLAGLAAHLRAGDHESFRTARATLAADAAQVPDLGLDLYQQLADVGLALATAPMGVADSMSDAATAECLSGQRTIALASRLMNLTVIRREQRRLHELEPILVAALATTPRQILRPLVATCRSEQDDRAGAVAELDVFLGGLEELRVDWTLLATLAFAAEEAAEIGHVALAEPLEARLVEHVPQVVVACSYLVVLGHLDRYLGLVASLRGDLDRAVELSAQAGARDTASGATLWAGWAAHDEASARLARDARGDRDAARRLLTEATSTAEVFDSARLRHRIDLLTSRYHR